MANENSIDQLSSQLTQATKAYFRQKIRFIQTDKPDQIKIVFPFYDDFNQPVSFYMEKQKDTITLTDRGQFTKLLSGQIGINGIDRSIDRLEQAASYPIFFADNSQIMMQAINTPHLNVYDYINAYVRIILILLTLGSKGSESL